ncbi:MAG: 2-amino-4-hydroxy-6-hydroxymethyldihydropteridine diphosphokinase [Pseudomonadota bacterium]
MNKCESVAYIGIGSNMGDAEANCLEAVRLLSGSLDGALRLSSLYRTEPQELKEQGWYVNAAAQIRSALRIREIFDLLKRIEAGMGRREIGRYGPRVIDLDLLLYGDDVCEADDLIVPHPKLTERRFVLIPLCELNPELVHPTLKRPISDLLAETSEKGQRVLRIEKKI